MITKVNPYGHISLTNDYFSGLVAQAARQCYGIAAMGETIDIRIVWQTLRNGSLPEKGVTVSQQDGRLVITLHIKVGYGSTSLRSRKASPTAYRTKWNAPPGSRSRGSTCLWMISSPTDRPLRKDVRQ